MTLCKSLAADGVEHIPISTLRPGKQSPPQLLSESSIHGRSDEALDEAERGASDLVPAAVDGEGMTAVRHLEDLGDAWIVLLLLVRGMRDRPRHGVILLAGDDEERPTIWIVGVDLHLGPWIEIGGGRLKERHPRGRGGARLIQLLRLFP